VRRALLLVMVVLGTIALPAIAQARTVKVRGVVVAKNARLHGYVLALRSGKLQLVRTTARIRNGRVIAVRGTLLADRSIRVQRLRRLGKVSRVRIRGTVLAHTRTLLTVGSNGAVVTVRRRIARGHAATTTVTNGSLCTSIDHIGGDGGLDEDSTSIAGSAPTAEFNGTVVSAANASGSANGSLVLTVGTSVLTIQVPTGVDVSALTAGSMVEVRVAITTDSTGVATLTLVSAHVEDHGEDGNHESRIRVTGVLTANVPGSITIQTAGGDVTMATGTIDTSALALTTCVRAKGMINPDGTTTLLRIHPSDDCDGHEGNGGGGGGHDMVAARGAVTISSDKLTATVNGIDFTIGTVDVSAFATGACVKVHGTRNMDGSISLVSIEADTGCTV